MNDPRNPADGKHIVVQNGQRVTGSLSQQEAEQESARRNQLNETSGKKVNESNKAQVKQNLCG